MLELHPGGWTLLSCSLEGTGSSEPVWGLLYSIGLCPSFLYSEVVLLAFESLERVIVNRDTDCPYFFHDDSVYMEKAHPSYKKRFNFTQALQGNMECHWVETGIKKFF